MIVKIFWNLIFWKVAQHLLLVFPIADFRRPRTLSKKGYKTLTQSPIVPSMLWGAYQLTEAETYAKHPDATQGLFESSSYFQPSDLTLFQKYNGLYEMAMRNVYGNTFTTLPSGGYDEGFIFILFYWFC